MKTSTRTPMPPKSAIAAAVRGQEAAMQRHMEILKNAALRAPTGDSQVAAMNDAIKWVRKNLALMDDMSKTEAFAAILYLAGRMETDPVEAGLVIKMLYGRNKEGAHKVLTTFRGKLDNALKMEWLFVPEKMEASKHFALLCAALGDTNCLRMVMFWADQALDADERTREGRKVAGNLADVPTKAVRIAIAYRETVMRLRGELDTLRAEGAESKVDA